MEWCGVDDATAQAVMHRILNDYMAVNWGWPMCCVDHELFLNYLKGEANGGSPMNSPMNLGLPPKH